jgi:hypothetical protein
MTMMCFTWAGGVSGVPVALQIVPGGNDVPLLLLELLLDVELLDVALLPEVELLELLPVLVLLALPPDPVDVDPFPPQAAREHAMSGIAAMHAVTTREGSFMGTFFRGRGARRPYRDRAATVVAIGVTA